MNTWVFETKSNKGNVLILVHSTTFESGWSIATDILKSAGHLPVKSNGYFGFSTKIRTLSYKENFQQGIINEATLKALVDVHLKDLNRMRGIA